MVFLLLWTGPVDQNTFEARAIKWHLSLLPVYRLKARLAQRDHSNYGKGYSRHGFLQISIQSALGLRLGKVSHAFTSVILEKFQEGLHRGISLPNMKNLPPGAEKFWPRLPRRVSQRAPALRPRHSEPLSTCLHLVGQNFVPSIQKTLNSHYRKFWNFFKVDRFSDMGGRQACCCVLNFQKLQAEGFRCQATWADGFNLIWLPVNHSSILH